MRFSKKLWLLLSACFVMALIPLFLLPHPRLPNSSMEFSQHHHNVPNSETFTTRNLPDDSGTLLPLDVIPRSPYYSFDERVMPRSFLLSLQNSSRRIIKEWTRKGFHRYEVNDITDCEALTPECAMHRYLLQRRTGEQEDPNTKPYRKCCVEHRALRETTLWVVRQLRTANITYFLSTGTALGVRRHAGTIIPWDTDVDLSIYLADKSRVKELFHKNTKHFFEKDAYGRQMFWIHHSPNGKPRGGPHVEIFYDSVYTSFPHLLLPLEECILYGEPVICPNMKQFDEWFPSGWEVYGGGHYTGPRRCLVYENGKKVLRQRC